MKEMTDKQYVEYHAANCRNEWFKNHKATVIVNVDTNTPGQTGCAKIINWQAPHTWNYGCRFILHRRWLVVVGDIGESAFEWGQDITLEFLAGLDLGYFLSKCRASEVGMKFVEWDREVAATNVQLRINEINDSIDHDEHDDELKSLAALLGESDKEAFANIAREYYDDTGDAETAGHMSEMGEVPHVRAISYWVALKMINEQLKGNL